jgi:hypothetical protein
MRKENVDIGELILIPIENGFVPAKVLYLSQRYKNVIMLGIYNIRMHIRQRPEILPVSFGLMVYTSQVPVLKKRWISIGHQPLLAGQDGIAKRIVAGDVWLGDQRLGTASENDRRSLSQMEILGANLVEKRATVLTAMNSKSPPQHL